MRLRGARLMLVVVILGGVPMLACTGRMCPPPCPPGAGAECPPAAAPAVPALSAASWRIIDLTHAMHDDMAFWPGGVPFRKTRLVDYDQGYQLHKFEVGENTGTHVDAPSHFVRGQIPIDRIPLEQLVVEAVVLDVKAKAAADADYRVSAQDVRDWEAEHGAVPQGALVIANTGWHLRFDVPERYVNKGADGVMHFPGYHPEAAELLVARDVAGIGIDTLSLDHGPSKDFATHHVMLKAGKYQIENLANLDALPPTGATVVIGVLPVKDGSQAQARILAFVPR